MFVDPHLSFSFIGLQLKESHQTPIGIKISDKLNQFVIANPWQIPLAPENYQCHTVSQVLYLKTRTILRAHFKKSKCPVIYGLTVWANPS